MSWREYNVWSNRRLAATVPFRYEYLRPGYFEVDARVRDMDINGTWASLNFPSLVPGLLPDVCSPDAHEPRGGSLAVTQAWNDWIYEEWYETSSDRIIPQGITFLVIRT